MTKTLTRKQQAELAVRKFQRMIPSLRPYARKVSGNPKLELVAGASSMTDGDTISIAPPLALGKPQRHNGMCNSRADGMSVCPACAAREELMEILHHEIGHILHGSFAKVNYSHALNILNQRDGYWHKLAEPWLERITNSIADNYSINDKPMIAHVNSARHPWLSMLMLIAEDIRCDKARIDFDPDQEDVFLATSERLLLEGVDRQDGSVQHYIDLEFDQQLCMAFLFASRFDIPDLEGYFEDEVLALVDTSEVRRIISAMLTSPGTEESFALALQALAYFNDNGHMTVDENDDVEELLKELIELLKAVFGHGLSIDGSDDADTDGTSSPSVGGDQMHEGKGDSEGDGLRPEDIAEALEALKHLDRVPVNVAPPRIIPPGGGESSNSYRGTIERDRFKSDERNLVPALSAARVAFGENARTQRMRNQRSGRLVGKTIAKRVPFGDDRIFGKKITPDKRDYAVVIGIDISGSTTGSTLEEEKFAALAMADVLGRLGIKFEVWAHTTGYASGYKLYPEMYQIKTADETWGDKQRDTLRRLGSGGGNLDGHSLQFYRKRLEAMRATDRILMYYTDGAMPATNYDEELEVLKLEIAYCAKNRITLMAVGMGVDSPTEYGFDTCQVNSPKDYRKVVEHLGKRLR
ncbi:CobT-like cobalamin biosynthesis protein [Gordonia phage Hail2Pitt]|uniref:CobT-like cobalamin biosynthesis protein n=1 Tax=Gordonia phage Hail2Pitt TaxID=2126785 RepID=A0A2P1N5U7_9CAUD|nr:CobT-like cobalamin biosynthesis protein [Gordonia phage Hail2Pitt]